MRTSRLLVLNVEALLRFEWVLLSDLHGAFNPKCAPKCECEELPKGRPSGSSRDLEIVCKPDRQDGRALLYALAGLQADRELLHLFAEAIPQVASNCESEEWRVRQQSLKALGEFAEKGHPLAIAAATTCLKDEDSEVREAAKAALAKLSKDGEGA